MSTPKKPLPEMRLIADFGNNSARVVWEDETHRYHVWILPAAGRQHHFIAHKNKKDALDRARGHSTIDLHSKAHAAWLAEVKRIATPEAIEAAKEADRLHRIAKQEEAARNHRAALRGRLRGARSQQVALLAATLEDEELDELDRLVHDLGGAS